MAGVAAEDTSRVVYVQAVCNAGNDISEITDRVENDIKTRLWLRRDLVRQHLKKGMTNTEYSFLLFKCGHMMKMSVLRCELNRYEYAESLSEIVIECDAAG